MESVSNLFAQRADAKRFLELLWPSGIPDDQKLLIWNLPEENSAWFSDIDSAINYSLKLKEKDIYVGVGLSPKDYGQKRRCKQNDISTIPGFYLDIDVIGSGRHKKNLFTNRSEAELFIDALPLQPTCKVWSGGGFQLWFLFKEELTFDDEKERDSTIELSRGFNNLIQSIAANGGRSVDSTYDLSRILRLPGTYNHKHEIPQLVVLLSDIGPRYNVSDFEQWRSAQTSKKGTKIGGLILNGDASPPFDLFNSLCSIDPDFQRTWNRARKDFKDQSPSSYDMSLANTLAFYEWSDQDICDTLIAHRRSHGSDLKLREDYYRRTISKARSSMLINSVSEILEKPQELGSKEEEKSNRNQLLALIRSYTGIAVEKLIQHGSDSAQYSLYVNETKVSIGTVSALTNFQTWINLSMVYGENIPHRPKADNWHKVLTAMKLVMEPDSSDDVKKENIVISWLRGYSHEAVDLSKANGEEMFQFISMDKPFRRSKVLYVRIDGFKTFMKITRKETISDSEILMLFRIVGLEREKVQARCGDGIIGRHYWKVNMEVINASEDSD